MANTNFIPWLGNGPSTGQQGNYKSIAGNGFEAGGLVKAGDFNAALRMTTLVCAGIARVFGFDTNTIDASEDIITTAIQTANITLGNITVGNITANIITAKSKIDTSFVNTGTVNAGDITVGNNIIVNHIIEGQSLNINGTQRIDSSGNITGYSYKVDEYSSPVIDENRNIECHNISADTINVSDTSITSLGYLSGSHIVIDNHANISAETITTTGMLKGNSLNINGTDRIDSSGNITGASYKVGSNAVIDSNRNITGNNITATGILKGESLIVTGTPSIDDKGNINVNSIKVNGSNRIDDKGNITGATVKSNGQLSGTFLNIGPLNDDVAAKVDINGNIITSGSIKTKVDNIETERITNSGIMIPSRLSLNKIKLCATPTLKLDDGKSSGSKVFGCDLPSYEYKRIYIFLVSINVQVKETNTDTNFNCDHFGLLAAPTASTTTDDPGSQGVIVFDIYTGAGDNVGTKWGQVRVSYQPYSITNNTTGCYLSCHGPSAFSGTVNITCNMYLIATF